MEAKTKSITMVDGGRVLEMEPSPVFKEEQTAFEEGNGINHGEGKFIAKVLVIKLCWCNFYFAKYSSLQALIFYQKFMYLHSNFIV